MTFRLGKGVEVVEREGGVFLVGKTPLCALRLNRPLADLLRGGSDGTIVPANRAEEDVLQQLAVKGLVRKEVETASAASDLPTVSVVIPVKDRAGELERCLESLSRLDYPAKNIRVVVVDDGSSDDSAEVARRSGAHVIPSGGTGRGPAAARNVGARAATGEILAFIDSDCTASEGWLRELVPPFSDPDTAAVGGFVDGMCTASAVDRYEAVMSSLSLGSRERTGNRGSDTFYLPSCNLLVRRSAFWRAEGFDDTMHVGEDVDLTWRLRDQGCTIRYLPAGRVFHEHRSTVRSFMSRRFDYGTSEGMLQILHPQRKKRLVVPPLLALLLILLVAAPFAGPWLAAAAGGILLADAAINRMRFARRNLPFGFLALLSGRVRALGSLWYYLSFHAVRYYLPVICLLSLMKPALFLIPGAMFLTAAAVDHAIKKPQLSFFQFTWVYLLEHVAYGTGVFCGCIKWGSFMSYRVMILGKAEAA